VNVVDARLGHQRFMDFYLNLVYRLHIDNVKSFTPTTNHIYQDIE